MLLNFVADESCQGCGQIKGTFRALTRDNILNPNISDQGFRSPKVNIVGEATNDIGYNI